MIPVATVIPFCNSDSHLVKDAIDSILAQTVSTKIYIVGDYVSEKTVEHLTQHYLTSQSIPTKYLYFFITTSRMGPYMIANSIAKYHTNCEYLAIQDADDISYPQRFEIQLASLVKNDHCSGPMNQIAMPGYTGQRHLREPTLVCGVKAMNVPYGRFINGTRMIRMKTFHDLNGFPPIFCSGDLCFDNTLHIMQVQTGITKQALGQRRLHPNSLTNNPATNRNAPLRKECMAYLLHSLRQLSSNPTMECARQIGGLDKAQPLEII
jgi:hypothetical protein